MIQSYKGINEDCLDDNYYALAFAITGRPDGTYPLNADESFKALNKKKYAKVKSTLYPSKSVNKVC